jgi:gluconate 2-dehydrogenase gamma chain
MSSRGKTGTLTRRQLLSGAALGGVSLTIGCRLGRSSAWEFLSDEQARTLAALCDQVVPADDFPSASQAGVLDYIDRQLARVYRRHRAAYSDGLVRLDTLSRTRFGRGIAALSVDLQFQAVTAFAEQDKSFFELVRNHTLEGYYGSPRHGGNRDAVSWRMLGLAEPPIRGRAPYDLTKGSTS